MTRAHRLIGGLILSALLACAGRARSQPEAWVRVTLPDCATPPLDLNELMTALRVELGTAGVSIVSDTAGPGATGFTLELAECSEDAAEIRVTLDFFAPSSSPVSLSTRLSLADVPRESRPRTIAVAMGELLRVTRSPPLVTRPPDVPSAPPTSPSSEAPSASPGQSEPHAPVLPDARQPRPKPLSYRAGAEVAWLAEGEDAFVGGAAEVAFDLPSHWRPHVALELLRNSVSTGLGNVDLTVFGVVAGWDRWLGAAGAIGPELRVDAVIAQGHSALRVREKAELAWFAAAGMRWVVEVAVSRRLALPLGLHADFALWGAEFTAAGQRAASFVGLQGGGTVGFAYR